MYDPCEKGPVAVVNKRTRREQAPPDESYHYPPELLRLLIETIPRLCRSKRDVLTFFHGAGVNRSFTNDLRAQLNADPDSLNKFDIARSVLTRMNEDGDRSLSARRKLVQYVTEFEDFSLCWPNQRLEAQGLVAEIRDVVNKKDSFTRINQERQAEARKRSEVSRLQVEEAQQRIKIFEEIKRDLYGLFAVTDPQKRGSMLEDVLNRFFKASGVLIRQAFARTGPTGTGIVEQIDGAIEVGGHIYLVEMKWHSQPLGVEDVSRHIVRVGGRGDCRGILISQSGYTAPAVEECKAALKDMVFVLFTLEEIVLLFERDDDFEGLLRKKVQVATLDKNPLRIILE